MVLVRVGRVAAAMPSIRLFTVSVGVWSGWCRWCWCVERGGAGGAGGAGVWSWVGAGGAGGAGVWSGVVLVVLVCGAGGAAGAGVWCRWCCCVEWGGAGCDSAGRRGAMNILIPL